jgi:hypothetical protein
MPPATAASMIGVVGKQNIVEIPSRFRISVIASMTSIGVFPGLSLMRPSVAPESDRRQPCRQRAGSLGSGGSVCGCAGASPQLPAAASSY